MINGHSAIDNLIALTALRKYQADAAQRGQSPYKQSQVPMSVDNLRLTTPIGEDSLYGKLFGLGTGVAEALSNREPSSVFEDYLSKSTTASDIIAPSAGALLLHKAARSKGIGVGGGGLSFPTKYGKFKVGSSNVGGARGVNLQFDLDKSILGKLEKGIKGYQEGGKVEENTILGLLSRGKYKTSEQIPPLSTTGKVTPENLKSLWTALNPPTPEGVEAPGLGMLEWAAAPPIGKVGRAIKGVKQLSKARKKLKKVADEFYESVADRQGRDWSDVPLSYRSGDDRLAKRFLEEHGYSLYSGFGPKAETYDYVEGGLRAYTPFKKGIKEAIEQKTFKNPTLKALRDWMQY